MVTRSLRRGVYVALLSAAVAATTTACGSSGGSSGTPSQGAKGAATSLAYANGQLAKYAAPVNVVPSGASFDASKLAGKTVWEIDLISTVPAIESVHGDITKAFAAAHVKVQQCDGQGTPVGWNACMQKAIAQKPAAMVLLSISPDTVSASLRAARAAKIPVFLDASFDSSAPLYPLATAQTSYDYTLGARLAADWIIAKSRASAHVLVIDTSDLSLKQAVTQDGYVHEFATHCPSCKVTVGAVSSIASWATDVTPLVVSELTRDPSINYIVAEYDAQAHYVAPALAQLGLSTKVKIAAYNADLEQMQAMASGSQPIGVDVGSDQDSIAWAIADQALRVMAGHPAGPKENTGTRVFTQSNAKGLPLNLAAFFGGVWYGSNSFEAAYRKLWHVQ